MEALDHVVKNARNCHTKQAWEALFDEHQQALLSTNNAKPLADIFKLLSQDPQCLQYDPAIFGTLIKGCLSAWNLELGKAISLFAKSLSSPAITIPAAQLFLERGELLVTRDLANRTLRLSKLSQKEKHQLQMLICSSYAEEGKIAKAKAMISKIEASLRTSDLAMRDQADFQVQMARMQFFLGRYLQASDLFRDASVLFLQLEDWEAAAKALFNTAACAQNAGSRPCEQAYAFVEESRRLAERYDLKGPLSHCEAFYGLDAYQHGNFVEAREHFRKALEFLPITDRSYRRLHILSMLTLSYLALGRYNLARKFGEQTLELAELDLSKRYQSRYKSLEAELIWEDGRPADSQTLLHATVSQFEVHGIHTLEDLSSYSRYLLQGALLGRCGLETKVKIHANLKKQFFTFLNLQYALGQVSLTETRLDEAALLFNHVLILAKKHDDKFHRALGLLGLIQVKLASHSLDEELAATIRDFKVCAHKLTETPLKANLHMVLAASAYQQGDFKETSRYLKAAAKFTRISFTDAFAINCWLATIEGKSPRLTHPWQVDLMARYTKTYFAPYLKLIDERTFQVGAHYRVSLERHASLAELLLFLLNQPSFDASLSDIQTHVWKQSLNTQGWQQKIRNSIMRLRDLFPYTMAPLILHHHKIELFKEAVTIHLPPPEGEQRADEIIRLLSKSPMTSAQLSRRLEISTATTKRTLALLVKEQKVTTDRHGRNIFYKPGPPSPGEVCL